MREGRAGFGSPATSGPFVKLPQSRFGDEVGFGALSTIEPTRRLPPACSLSNTGPEIQLRSVQSPSSAPATETVVKLLAALSTSTTSGT